MALAPPIADAPLADDGAQHSKAWTAYNQAVADNIARLNAAMGVTDGSDAGAGQVGEIVTTVAPGPGIALANNVQTDIASLPLTAGDWDLRGEVWFHTGSGVTGDLEAGISTVSGALPGAPDHGARTMQAFTHTANAGAVLPLASCRFSLSGPATAFLIAFAGYSSGSAPTAYGVLSARRMR
jgi:hypothetical protein